MTMPAGKYWVGDLCYVMHDEWDEVCGLMFQGRDDGGCNEGEFNLKDGRRFVSYNTRYGDGEYFDEQGRAYGVDAGLIGCIAVKDIDFDNPGNTPEGGHIIDFTSDFNCSGGRYTKDWDGCIRIHNVHIETSPSEEYGYE